MSTTKGLAIVTGASSGIGAVYADRLAKRGHDLVLVARRRDRLESLAETIRADHGRKVELVVADLAAEADLIAVDGVVRDAENLGVLVNCAGVGALGAAATIDPDIVDAMVKLNVVALTRLSLTAARRFAAAQSGTIVNVGSIIAIAPTAGAGGYSGSKAYVLNFSRSLQAELGASGVTVQAVMPGPVSSEFFGDKPAPFPEQLFMTPQTLVDTALAALDQGETVTFPTLHDIEAWRRFEEARIALLKGTTQNGLPAARYAPAAGA